jgi:hypothetical protein
VRSVGETRECCTGKKRNMEVQKIDMAPCEKRCHKEMSKILLIDQNQNTWFTCHRSP